MSTNRDPLARFAEAPKFGPFDLEFVRLIGRSKATGVFICTCGEIWQGRAAALNKAVQHVYLQGLRREVHTIRAEWRHEFVIVARRPRS